MKKIILLGAFIGLTIVSFAQTGTQVVDKTLDKVGNSADKIANTASNAVSTVYSDSKSSISQVYGDLKDGAKYISPKLEEAIKSLANGLKVGATEVWTIIVQQQYVYSWCILLILLATVGSWIHFWYRYGIWQKSTEEGFLFGCILTFGVALSGTFIVGFHFYDMMTGFLNPKFGAMKTIAEIASQIK